MATRGGIPSIPRATPAVEARKVESLGRRVPKRRRFNDELGASSSGLSKRQKWVDQDAITAAKKQCQLLSGNDIISCYPTSDTTIAQGDWTTFVWNSRRPELTQNNRVDAYLFRADSGRQVLHYRNQINPPNQAGSLQAPVNDSWWGDDGLNWDGKNTTFQFFWVLIDSDKTLDGSQINQPVFQAVQTTYADSVIASMSSASAAASSSSVAASLSSASASSASAASVSKTRNNPSSTGAIQSDDNAANFPHWAIAVIVVLGFLAILAACIVIFLLIRRRRRREHDERRDSMNSASPMIQHPQGGPSSPLLAGAVMGRGGSIHDEKRRDAPSVVGHDGASTISRSGSANEGPFSGADAAIMADAFRKMLRKPDFAGQPVEEGESPENEGKSEMINRELAEEGRDIRSVRSERGYKLETTSDDGADTIQDHRDR